MKQPRLLFIVCFVVFGIVIGAMFFWREAPAPPLKPAKMREVDVNSEQSFGRRSEIPAGDAYSNEKHALEKMSKISFAMTKQELDHLRVNLPAPVNMPWKGPFYDSQTCFDADKKLAAVDVLPLWIKEALSANESNMAARYLWSFIKFTEDKDNEVATKAVISLYRMGDYNGVALSKMKQWLESGFDYTYLDTSYGTSDMKDARRQVLQELDYYNDASLLGTIYDLWSNNKGNEGEDLASVDYAYYLEKHGRELPVDYWLGRLNKPYAFENALNVLEARKPDGMTETLQPLFEQLRTKLASSPDARRAAAVGGILFQLTGDTKYREYLMERAQRQFAFSPLFADDAQPILNALAATNDKAALDLLFTAIQNKNEGVRKMAIDALGNSKNPEAAEMLYESAIQEAKTRFPSHQLHALLQQNEPSSDSKYERLQQALLSGQLGWQAVSSDFATFEFTRKYGRH